MCEVVRIEEVVVRMDKISLCENASFICLSSRNLVYSTAYRVQLEVVRFRMVANSSSQDGSTEGLDGGMLSGRQVELDCLQPAG